MFLVLQWLAGDLVRGYHLVDCGWRQARLRLVWLVFHLDVPAAVFMLEMLGRSSEFRTSFNVPESRCTSTCTNGITGEFMFQERVPCF